MRQWCLTLFAGYRYWISPFLRLACRFVPTCSEYTSAAISRYGVLRGGKPATSLLLKWYQFHLGEMDPVKL